MPDEDSFESNEIPQESEEEMRSEAVVETLKLDSEYNKKLVDFKKSEEKRVKMAEKKLLPRCSKCSKALRSKIDVSSHTKNDCCFSCFTIHEKDKTDMVIDSKFAEKYDRIANLDFADFENWLFGDELGEQCLMRIVMKMRREGYDIPTWKISLAATAWAMDNYANTNLVETRHILERSPLSQIVEGIPQSNTDIKKLIHYMGAEESKDNSLNNEKRLKKEYIYMGIIGGISLLIPILMNKER